jgi:hypothetical protein
MSQIKIQTSFGTHNNILKLIGFRFETQTCLMIFEITNETLLDVIRSDAFKVSKKFTSLFYRFAIEIITAMVRVQFLIGNKLIIIINNVF